MAITRPVDVPRFANAQTDVDALMTAMSGSELDQGYHVNEIPSSAKLNYLLNQFARWLAWLNDPDLLASTVGVIGGYVGTNGPEIQHPTATHVYGASDIGIVSTWTLDNASNALLLPASSGTGELQFHIPQVRGSRVKAVRVYCRALGGVAADITVAMRKVTAAAGSAGPTVATLTDTTTAGTTVNSAANANIQSIAFTLSVAELAANESLVVRIHGANTSGDKAIWRIEVDVDRVSNAA